MEQNNRVAQDKNKMILWTKEYRREYNKQYSKQWRKDNKEYKRECYKKWKKKNPKKIKEYRKRYKKNHPEKVKEINERWRKNHLDKIREWERIYYSIPENRERKRKRGRSKTRKEKLKKRRQIDSKFCIDDNMAAALRKSLRGRKAGRHWEDLVGYTVEDLMKHLEKLFEPWMNWDNYGKWHIDHKKPKSLFHYTEVEDSEFKECWALKNLQPMEAMANIKKGNKYIKSRK